MKLGEKIRAIREAKHLSKTQFAKELHTSDTRIGAIESGKGTPSDSLLELITKKFEISVDWWETGEGEMFSKERGARFSPPLEQLIAMGLEKGDAWVYRKLAEEHERDEKAKRS